MRRRDWLAVLERVLATGLILLLVALAFGLAAMPSVLVPHAQAIRDRIGLAGISTSAVTAGLIAVVFAIDALWWALKLSDSGRGAWSLRWEWRMVRFIVALIGCAVCLVVAWALA